jgi:hypothetical protein
LRERSRRPSSSRQGVSMRPNTSFQRTRLRSPLNSLSSDRSKEMSQNIGAASSPTGPWVWLFPLALGLHIAEEYAFHFPTWVANLSGRYISNPQFVFLNAILWLLMVAVVVLIRVRPSQVLRSRPLSASMQPCIFSVAPSPPPIHRAPHPPSSLCLSSYTHFDASFHTLAVALRCGPWRSARPFTRASCSWRPTHRSSHRRERSNPSLQRTRKSTRQSRHSGLTLEEERWPGTRVRGRSIATTPRSS